MTRAEFITAEERAVVRTDIASAETLPNRAFTSPEWFELEVDVIYRGSWVAFAFEHEISEPGDVLPRDLVRMPLLLVRDETGEIHGFHNVCPYDGCPVALEPQSGRTTIRAPYHGWRYDLRGKVVAIPFWDGSPEGDLASLNGRSGDLVPIHVATRFGVVFVCLAEVPPPFDEYTAPLSRMLDPWDLECMEPGLPSMSGDSKVFSYDVHANWKTYYENTNVNVLHEGFTHVLYDVSPEVPRVRDGKKTYWDLLDEHLVALAYRHDDFPQTYPELGVPHMGKAGEPENAYFAAFFPNLHLAVSRDWVNPVIALPTSPEHTVAHETYFMHPSAANEDRFRTAREVLYFTFRIAHSEDNRVMAGVQRGRHSPVADRKFFAPFWDAMHHRFNQIMLDVLEARAPWPAMRGQRPQEG